MARDVPGAIVASDVLGDRHAGGDTMTPLLGMSLLAYFGWLLLQWWCERPSVPPHVAKRFYRLANGLLWVLWALTAVKALQWHTELVTLLPFVPR